MTRRDRPKNADFLEMPAAEFAAPFIAQLPDTDITLPDEANVRALLATALGDRYVIERELGRGGTAIVYLAQDVRHRRLVALKVLQPALARLLGADRFLREIEVAARLAHPHILPLHDSGSVAGSADDVLYYIMPYVDGESLRDRLARERQLPVAIAVRLAREVAAALGYAHRNGVVHRDIKPENILLLDGHAVVADFGIARALASSRMSDIPSAPRSAEDVPRSAGLTALGAALGTPAYMSPEQASGAEHLDGRTDIYSLGCVLYEMLAGEPPVAGRSVQAVMDAQRGTPPASVRALRESVSPVLEQVIGRAMARVAADRFETAEELGVALAGVEAQLAAPAADRRPRRAVGGSWRRTLALGAALLAVGTGATIILRGRRPSPPAAGAAAGRTIAIVPFAPASRDTALVRLGRDLVVTLSANLDGVGGIHTTDALTVLANVHAGATPSLGDALAVVRRLGASAAVFGSVVRIGDRVRLDLALHPVDGGSPLARTSVSAPMDSLGALTDSTTWALLRQLWRGPDAPTPSLTAVTTHSIPALRAFLEGERLIVEGRWRAAPDAFERAFTLDSTFWLAYWRYSFARNYWTAPVDPAITAKVRAHRTEFPERDRLLVEADMSDSLSVRYQRAKAVAEQFPAYWPAWWLYSERLTHDAPLIGTTSSEMRQALEHTLALNPGMMSAWEHLFWGVALRERDTVLSARVLTELTRLHLDSTSRAEGANDQLGYDRALDYLVRTGGLLSDSIVDVGYADLSRISGRIDPMSFALGMSQYGFARAQADFSRRLLARGMRPQMEIAQRLALAVAEAATGAWDSSLVALDAFAASTSDPAAPLYRYRVSVVGAWLGALDPEAARLRRGAVARAIPLLPPSSRAELAWLDGLLAVARHDASALAAARHAVREADRVTAPILDRSLGAFALHLGGDDDKAADSLVRLERDRAENGWSRWQSDLHPFLTAVNRLAAARWLSKRGDHAEAARLLTWHEGIPYPEPLTRQANAMVEGLAYLERARVAEALDRGTLARTYYQRFLAVFDAPSPGQRHLAEDARRALQRLGPVRER